MDLIIGGDQPLTNVERFWKEAGVIIDFDKVNLPKYNPWTIKLARNLEGVARYEFAKRSKLTTKRYTDIENGDAVPTEAEIDKIAKASTHVLRSFFEQWQYTEPDFSQAVARPIPIDYYKYKVFRDINRPLTMKAVS